jgi:uncharacterized membrane protein (UPF0127 family)
MIKKVKTNKTIVQNKQFLRSLFEQGIGLMFRFKPIEDIGYIFVMRKEIFVPITMMNVFIHLDILWVNEQKEIVAICENAKPFQLNIAPKVKAKYIIELPVGTVKKHKLDFFDKLGF